MKKSPSTRPANSDTDVAALVLSGLQAHQAGHFDVAAEAYAQALRAKPDHPDALSLAGALAYSRGEIDAAIKLIAKAIRVFPAHYDAYLNLAEALEAAGRSEDAIETCRKVLTLKPDFADAYARIARLHAQIGKSELAFGFSRVALALNAQSVEALCARGLALRQLHKLVEAEEAYRSALALAPDDVKTLSDFAALLNQTDDLTEAAQLYRRAVAIKPDDPHLLTLLGGVIEREGDMPEALALFDRAASLAPAAIDIAYARACCLRDSGDFSGAEAGFRANLAADPNFAPALHALTRMKRLAGDQPEQKRLARLTSEPTAHPRYRAMAGFALGEILDRAGDPDSAFKRFADANGTLARYRATTGETFDMAELRNFVTLTQTRLATEFARDATDWGHPSQVPVFVIGLPRSGTTLVEQICASHSRVAGAGELRSVQMIARRFAGRNQGKDEIRDWDATFARAEGERYLSELARIGGDAVRVVDKSPLNLMRLGIIGGLFPKARVIWCRRDLRDVVVSNHTMYFSEGNLYSTSQTQCATASRLIDGLGACWKRESKLPILEVVYEDLVADLDTHVRRIIDFIGVDWEPACLNFHATDRHVSTPSSWQVRQPIYSSSVGRWKRFEKHLAPMLAALAAPLE